MQRRHSIPNGNTKNLPWSSTCCRRRTTWSFHVLVLQRTAKKCTKIYNACAQPLFFSLNLLFSDVIVPVVVMVCLSSLISVQDSLMEGIFSMTLPPLWRFQWTFHLWDVPTENLDDHCSCIMSSFLTGHLFWWKQRQVHLIGGISHFFNCFLTEPPRPPQEIPVPFVGVVWIFSGTAQWESSSHISLRRHKRVFCCCGVCETMEGYKEGYIRLWAKDMSPYNSIVGPYFKGA